MAKKGIEGEPNNSSRKQRKLEKKRNRQEEKNEANSEKNPNRIYWLILIAIILGLTVPLLISLNNTQATEDAITILTAETETTNTLKADLLKAAGELRPQFLEYYGDLLNNDPELITLLEKKLDTVLSNIKISNTIGQFRRDRITSDPNFVPSDRDLRTPAFTTKEGEIFFSKESVEHLILYIQDELGVEITLEQLLYYVLAHEVNHVLSIKPIPVSETDQLYSILNEVFGSYGGFIDRKDGSLQSVGADFTFVDAAGEKKSIAITIEEAEAELLTFGQISRFSQPQQINKFKDISIYSEIVTQYQRILAHLDQREALGELIASRLTNDRLRWFKYLGRKLQPNLDERTQIIYVIELLWNFQIDDIRRFDELLGLAQ